MMKNLNRPLRSFCLLLLIACSANAYDLRKTRVERLENGLTVMLLEDRTQPLVSTQVLYKAGGRNECTGATGLAHYVEHMAFRATKNFPDTQVVSKIYAEGGEWHGYTWIDQTTYFETVPIEDLDLVLQIQADRMANTLIKDSEVEAERGSVMTELRGYENDPSSVLSDAVVAAAFQQHPYRYNVIGWPSDVEKITHKDLVNFYTRFYNPSNAVLAIAGDITAPEALSKVQKYFSKIPGAVTQSEPRTVEPPQAGERRVTLQGTGSVNYFQISWHAPAANDPDYPAFLMIQALLAGPTGVNFRQRSDADVREGTRLDGIEGNLKTYFFSSADPYVFTITGHIKVSDAKENIENQIEARMRELREKLVSDQELEKTKAEFLKELVFDIETTEDAAHQMAFFEGVGAFEVLQKLPELISRVFAADIQRVAQKYLQSNQRTVGWYLGDGKKISQNSHNLNRFAKAKYGDNSETTTKAALAQPRTRLLRNGITVIVQKITRSPAGFLRAVVPSNEIKLDAEYSKDNPLWGYTSITKKFLKEDLSRTVGELRKSFDKPFSKSEIDPTDLDDPESRLNATLEEMLGLKKRAEKNSPSVVVLVGDIDEENALELLSRTFGNLPNPGIVASSFFDVNEREKIIRMPGKAQSQLGYAVPAAPPSDSTALTWKMLRYIMTHDYEGRLGMELIARQGLLYGIDSGYVSDGQKGWVYITTGVNPEKLSVVKQRFQEIMRGLVSNPPSSSEIAEAKNYLIGRRKTSYQSNQEISGFLATEWIENGKLLSQEEFEERLNAVTEEQLRDLVSSFLSGVTVVIDCSL
jgi:zinc protease